MVNYSKGDIYKILYLGIIHYIGSSTNFKRRKTAHKNVCNDVNDKHYNIPLYAFMRNNNWKGNWGDWTIEIVEHYPCKDKISLLLREKHFINEYNPLLNVKQPIQTDKEYRENNKITIKKQRASFHKKNSERLNAKSSVYYQENKEAMNATSRINYAKNADDRKIKSAKYQLDNKEKIKIQRALAYKLKKEKTNLIVI